MFEGFGGAVAEVLGKYCPVYIEMMEIADRTLASAPLCDLMRAYSLTPIDVVKRAKTLMSKRSNVF